MSKTIKTIDGTNGKFEYYEYNDDLKLIHSVEDDMFQAKSIIESLGSNKDVHNWIRNKDTKELIEGFTALTANSRSIVLFTEKQIQGDKLRYLKGTYIHRLLVNHFAFWVSKKYAYKIAILLDDKFEMERLHKDNSDKQDKIDDLIKQVSQLHEDNEKLHNDNIKQSKQIDSLLKENKKQTKILHKQDNKIDDLTDMLKGNEGRLSGKEVKDSKVLMMYLEPEYEGFNKNVKDSYIIPIRISRIQPTSMKNPVKQIYESKQYIFISYLPEAITQNKSILQHLSNNEDISDYLRICNKGGITKIEINTEEYLKDIYNDDYINKSSKRLTRKINELLEMFICCYKKELRRATQNKIFNETYSDNEEIMISTLS